MKIHESGEDYLEAVLVLPKRNGAVRSVDLADHMGYSKPSISHESFEKLKLAIEENKK